MGATRLVDKNGRFLYRLVFQDRKEHHWNLCRIDAYLQAPDTGFCKLREAAYAT